MSLTTELIERLRKEADGYKGNRSKRAVRVKHILREAADTIETLSAKVQAANMERSTAYYNGGWIPVSERLPEAEYGESGSVLVCFENETLDVLYFDGSNWRYPTGEIYVSVNHKNGWHNKVIAWMPLPKPFEPQERSE